MTSDQTAKVWQMDIVAKTRSRKGLARESKALKKGF